MATGTAGTASTAGTGNATAGTTGAAGTSSGMAGTNGMTGGGGGGEPPAMGFCGSALTVGSHITIDVSWEGSLALEQGSGKLHLWLFGKHTKGADGNYTFEERTCGSIVPDVTTTAIAGGQKISAQIPDATWDIASMPSFPGTVTVNGSTRMINPSPALVGVMLSDPNVAWPDGDMLRATQVDHDGDGKIGITNLPKEGNGYSLPPTSLLQTQHADQLYVATRPVLTLMATVEGCPDMYTGTANVTKFDIAIIGCRIKETGADCSTSDAQFVYDNQPTYILGSSTFVSKILPATSTCADVRAALP